MSDQPVLDWPDSPGWWWCEYTDDAGFLLIEIVSVDAHRWMYETGREEPIVHEEGWKKLNRGSVRFSKLLEKPPFGDKYD